MGKSKRHDSKPKKKHKHKERKDKKKKTKKHSREKRKYKDKTEYKTGEKAVIPTDDFSIPVELMNSKSHAPETPEEYRQRQNRMRREIDPVTGRSRLIKGDGEVIEEIVSKERHKAINKEATQGDGAFFQENLLSKR